MAQTKSLYLTKVQLKAELDRCLNCANKPCMNACPVNCSPQEFISHAKNGDFEQAVATITRNNPMGQTCGLICPDKFCMKACTRSRIDFAVNIPKVQATILENYRNPSAEAKAIRPNGRKVAVIGAGPAGLAAAAELGKQGYYVCLYEASDKIGGALNMIPDERLPYEVIAKDWSFIFNRDFITLYLTTKIGSPSDLFSQGFDGVIVATGEPNVTDLGIPGQEYAVSYMEYLHHPSKYETKGRVAVIGGGPAGLSCAYYLAEKGYRPTVFEREARPGGMLMNGIPSFRLEKDVVEAEIDILRELGVEFRCGVEVGKDVTIAQLREQGYQGFYVAVGLQSGGKLNIPGGDADGVMAGIDFMRQVNLHEKKTLSGKVVVIGGGNIGADVARTAVRCGAESVDLYCLEAYDGMPMGEEDRSECERDGITVHAGWGQTEIVVEDGKCAGIRFRKCTRVKNDEGRFAPEFDDSVSEQAECTTVLYCIGQKVDWRELLTGTAVEFNPNGTVKADPVTYQTAEKDIFVGGDAYTGQKFAIDAIAAGKEGAISLHRFVQHATLTVGRNRRQFIELNKENALIPVNYDTTPRQRIGYNEALRRTFSDERVAFTEEQIKKETARCLSCGASIVDPNKCIGCGVCTTKCAFDAIHLHRERPECSKMYACEDKMKAILPYMIKREFKIKRAARKSK